MRKLLILFAFLCLNVSAEKFSFSSQSVHNLYASFIAIPNYIQACLVAQEQCNLNDFEVTLAQKIMSTAYNYEHLKIIEPDLNGAPFDMGDDQHRIAVTGSKAPSVIYFNSRFFVDEKAGVLSQLTVLAILLHEMGHHFGVEDGPIRPLDQFAQKIASFINQKTQTFDLAIYNQPQIKISFFNSLGESFSPVIPSFPFVTVSDGESLQIFNGKISSQMICPYGTYFPNHIWAEEISIKALGDYNLKEGILPLYLGVQTGHHCRYYDEDDQLQLGESFNTSGYFRVNLKSDNEDLFAAKNVSLAENSYFESIRLFRRFEEASLIIKDTIVKKSDVGSDESWEIKVTGLSVYDDKWDVMPVCTIKMRHKSYEATDVFGDAHFQQLGSLCTFKKNEDNTFIAVISGKFSKDLKDGVYEVHGFEIHAFSNNSQKNQILFKKLNEPIEINFKNSSYVDTNSQFKFRVTNRGNDGRIQEPFVSNNDNPYDVIMPWYERVTFEVHSRLEVDSFYLKYDVYLKDGRILSRAKSHLRYSNYSMNTRLVREDNHIVYGSRYSLSSEEAGNFDLIDYVFFKELFIYTADGQEYRIDLSNKNHILRINK